MSGNKLKILRTNAVEAYETGTADNKALLEKLWPGEFKPISVFDRINSLEAVFADQGTTQEEFNNRITGDTDDEVSYKLMKLISRAMNELKPGEELDPTKPWYFPVFNRDPGFGFSGTHYDRWNACTDVGSRLSFKDSQRAMHAGKTFLHVYKPFMLCLPTNQTNQ